jgi:hypothetical protein
MNDLTSHNQVGEAAVGCAGGSTGAAGGGSGGGSIGGPTRDGPEIMDNKGPIKDSTPDGRPYTDHYLTETGPERNIPGSVVDHVINTTPGIPRPNGTTYYYDPSNNVTVITGTNGGIVSVHKGPGSTK